MRVEVSVRVSVFVMAGCNLINAIAGTLLGKNYAELAKQLSTSASYGTAGTELFRQRSSP